jgi:hypothetical protein
MIVISKTLSRFLGTPKPARHQFQNRGRGIFPKIKTLRKDAKQDN